METIAICLVFISLSVCSLVWFYRYHRLTKTYGNLSAVRHMLEQGNTELTELERTQKRKKEELDNLHSQIAQYNNERTLAEEKRNAAVELAEKDLELEMSRRKAEYEANLDKEFENLKNEHPLTKTRELLQNLNQQVDEARRTIKAQQEQAARLAEKENFIDVHSIGLSEIDEQDIEMIREFAPRLGRKDAFFKLIWTEFYQRPLQALCKALDADKVTGIYKITNIKNDRMYIGQAVDIGTRWKDHVKTGLGIGATSYMSNKFYKALHDEGPENFTFEILELCSKKDLDARERYWIDFYNSTSFGYNTKIGG